MSDELTEFLSEGAEEVPTGETQTETEAVTETPPEVETEAAAEPEVSAEAEVSEGSTPEPEGKQSDKGGTVPLAALLDEREKRQQFERQLKAIQNNQQPTQNVVPDVLDDQQGFVDSVRGEIQQATMNVRIEVSQEVMRAQHEDYDAAEAKFLEMAANDLSLQQKMAASPLPAKFAYDYVKDQEKISDITSGEWEAKKTAEIEARVRAELSAKTKADASGLSPSLSGVAADGGNTQAPVNIPDPLTTTFAR